MADRGRRRVVIVGGGFAGLFAARSLRQILKRHHHAECVLAEVIGIDPAARTVQAQRPLGEVIEFGYDGFAFTRGLRRERTLTSGEVGRVADVYAVGGSAPDPQRKPV
ncbi:MAG TPA: hypothetical protein VGH77_20490 [Streptosporangiaceae bacterium]|jgi:NADH dehydrogenase FAD-containing subunit